MSSITNYLKLAIVLQIYEQGEAFAEQIASDFNITISEATKILDELIDMGLLNE